MSQNAIILPTTGTVSGLQMTQDTNNALDTLNTLWAGASAPSSPEAGQVWHDSTTNTLKLRSLDNTAWIVLFSLNESGYYASPANAAQAGFVNKFRNPAFDVAQRGTSGMVSSGATAYTLDGYAVSAVGAAAGWSFQMPGVYGSTGALTLSGASGLTDAAIYQRIESRVAQPLAGGTATFQAMIYNNSGASVTPTLTVKHAGAVDDWTSPVTDVSAVSLQPCANNGWTLVTYSFAASSASGNGLQVTLDYGAALNGSGKTISTTNWDIRATPFLPVGLNSTVPGAELRIFTNEIAFCQRYFQKLGGETTSDMLGSGYATTMSSCQIIIPVLPVKMRTQPTLSFGNAGDFVINTVTAAATVTSITLASIASYGGVTLTVGATGLTSGQTALFRTNTSSDYLSFSAEL